METTAKRKRGRPKKEATANGAVRAAVSIPLPLRSDAETCPDLSTRVTVLESIVAAIGSAPDGSVLVVNEGVVSFVYPTSVDSTLELKGSTNVVFFNPK